MSAEAKPALKSKTVWGVIILAMAPFVAEIGDALQTAGGAAAEAAGQTGDVMSTAMTFLGAMLALVGRMAAAQPLK